MHLRDAKSRNSLRRDREDALVFGGCLTALWLLLGLLNYIFFGAFRALPWKRIEQLRSKDEGATGACPVVVLLRTCVDHYLGNCNQHIRYRPRRPRPRRRCHRGLASSCSDDWLLFGLPIIGWTGCGLSQAAPNLAGASLLIMTKPLLAILLLLPLVALGEDEALFYLLLRYRLLLRNHQIDRCDAGWRGR